MKSSNPLIFFHGQEDSRQESLIFEIMIDSFETVLIQETTKNKTIPYSF